ncbi:hypothetical protein [Pelagibius sp. Alg239-R121]|uniref:hypothetical protein n=1 Tax=Pelagibius sp. Alg239-R121 TaxID=2993448 RepID=UPI0024A76E9B|nr:hypothetical protein [Pelagibius sp. Alg239-R121]
MIQGVVRRISRSGRLLSSGTLACMVVAASSTLAMAQVRSLEEVAASVGAEYDVEVLKSAEVEMSDGSLAYELVVMNQGGDFNEAFQVTRLLVDPNTGNLISRFQHGNSGYDLSGAPRYNPGRDGADSMLRRDSLR